MLFCKGGGTILVQPVLQGRRMNPIPEYLDEVVHVGILLPGLPHAGIVRR